MLKRKIAFLNRPFNRSFYVKRSLVKSILLDRFVVEKLVD